MGNLSAATFEEAVALVEGMGERVGAGSYGPTMTRPGYVYSVRSHRGTFGHPAVAVSVPRVEPLRTTEYAPEVGDVVEVGHGRMVPGGCTGGTATVTSTTAHGFGARCACGWEFAGMNTSGYAVVPRAELERATEYHG